MTKPVCACLVRAAPPVAQPRTGRVTRIIIGHFDWSTDRNLNENGNMRIANLFKKDISRPINGVVKADQLDKRSVWQELDEFVVTTEIDGHLRKFFGRYLEAIENPNDPAISGKIGVWISGFFGSGKSHFIKVLS
jgi:hypothetical protein